MTDYTVKTLDLGNSIRIVADNAGSPATVTFPEEATLREVTAAVRAVFPNATLRARIVKSGNKERRARLIDRLSFEEVLVEWQGKRGVAVRR